MDRRAAEKVSHYLSQYANAERARKLRRKKRQKRTASKKTRGKLSKHEPASSDQVPFDVVEKAREYYSAHIRGKARPSTFNDELSLDDEILEAVAEIQDEWDDETRLLRVLGISQQPQDCTKLELMEQIHDSLGAAVSMVRVFPCDRRKFKHSYFERGGSAAPRGHTPEDADSRTLPHRFACSGAPPYVYDRSSTM